MVRNMALLEDVLAKVGFWRSVLNDATGPFLDQISKGHSGRGDEENT